jgi:rubrerythrin
MAADPVLARAISGEDLTVIRHLETAFEEETKNTAACRAYAARADEEGFHGIASLFRAIGRAEQIHAANHARVLRYMSGPTTVEIPLPRVDGSLENLRTALADQRFEVDYLYPTFLTAAVPLVDSTAIRTFHWALEADKSHVRLLWQLLPRVGADKAGWAYTPHHFFVCALCGYAAQDPESDNCPSCNYLWDRFENIQ